jgi:hypothetical protein
MARAIREYHQDVITPEHFWHTFDRYTHLQYRGDDFSYPLVTEYYNSQTGEPDPRGCPDYFHSTYNDLIIRHVAGIEPRGDDTLRIRPIPGPLDRFALRGLKYHGHDVDVLYHAEDAGHRGNLAVYVDGRLAGQRAGLGDLTIELPAAR